MTEVPPLRTGGNGGAAVHTNQGPSTPDDSQANHPSSLGMTGYRLKKAARKTGPPVVNREEGYQLRLALICIMRGEASPPRNDPTILVGVLTVLMMVPKLGSVTSATGSSKLTWLSRLKICSPIPKRADSHLGIGKFFMTERSVLK